MNKSTSFPLSPLRQVFAKHFGKAEVLVRAPGRANIIGEHTDYNGGHVLPFALDQCVYLLAALSTGPDSKVYSMQFDEEVTLTNAVDLNSWTRYSVSAINILSREGYKVKPFNLAIDGDLPIGAGLSSSSALTCGLIAVLNKLNNLSLSDKDIIRLASMAENATGLEGGKMDQSAIMEGLPNQALLLDCNTLSHKYIPLSFPNHDWLIINSNVHHSLVSSDYNTRFEESRKGFDLIKAKFDNVTHFKDLRIDHVHFLKDRGEMKLANRILHFVTEEKRVSQMEFGISENDVDFVGQLLYESHKSLSYNYDVSCEEIDFLISRCKKITQIPGARMMGGGFGGSIIALCDKGSQVEVSKSLNDVYLQEFDKNIDTFIVIPSQGLSIHSEI